jgi:[citrate (pro-3S)-lyase] ligase
MATFTSLESRTYPPFLPEDQRAIEAFLRARGLRWEDDIDFSVACLVDGTVVGTGSLAGRIIKCMAVDEAVRGEGIAATLISQLEAKAASRGTVNPFVFTHPRNTRIFSSMGYRSIGEVPGAVALLEKGDGLERWLHSLSMVASWSEAPESGSTSVLVMNCNPITRGHLHLIQAAASSSARVFLFIVAEEASVFPFDVRLRLVREATATMPNVTVLPGREYLISRATFPSYFLDHCPCEMAEVHARLDANIFSRRIAPSLGAARRFIGEEPYCPVTAIYNRVLKDVLPAHGVEVIEIPRLSLGGTAVSASEVRRLLRGGHLEAAQELVPPAAADYLGSAAAIPVIQRITEGNGRH